VDCERRQIALPVGDGASRGCERRKSRLCRGEEERVDTLFRPRATSTKGASEASTSPSGELWDRTKHIQSRDARAAGSNKMSVGPSKYELQGPTV
jgi:hypothetical protein